MRSAGSFAAVLFVLGCGGGGLQTGPTAPTLVQVGDEQRAVRTLTDLDDVRDVASSGDRVFVATDLGLLIHPADGGAAPRRITAAEGLPSDDVRAVAASPEGAAVVGTAAGIATVTDGEVTPMEAPPVGEVTDLLVDERGTLWACGLEGVARLGADGWERFGEQAACTTLAPTPEGELWVGTTSGLWHVQGDVVREHGLSALPEGYVRDVVPVRPGQAMAILQGPNASQIGFFDGDRWYGYGMSDFGELAVGLAELDGSVVLLTPHRAYSIAPAAQAEGVPLTALSRSEPRQAVAYRARITPLAAVRAVPSSSETRPEVPRAPSPVAQVPESAPVLDAPAFVVGNLKLPLAAHAYLVRREPGRLFVAQRNLGVTAVDTGHRATTLRSNDLVREEDLQIASSSGSRTWTIGTHHDPARWSDDGFIRAEVPEGVVAHAIADGPQGLYVVTLVQGSRRDPSRPSEGGEPAAEGDSPEGAETEGAETEGDSPEGAEAEGDSPEATETEGASSEGAETEGASSEGAAAGGPASAADGPPAAAHEATMRIYRVGDEGWTPVAERAIRTATRLVGAPFLGVTRDEIFWVGLRVEHESGEGTRMRGVAVFGVEGEEVTYHHRGDGLRMPDEVTGVDLGQSGYAWLPSLSGAIRVGEHQAVVFGEARGVRGEVVSDLEIGSDGRVWVAAAEGVGYRDNESFEFGLPEVVQRARPTALALDSRANLWGAGSKGVVHFDGQQWQQLTGETGLPTDELVDVEVDAHDGVWLLARDRVVLFSRP